MSETISQEFREHLKEVGSPLFDTESGGVVTIAITSHRLEIAPFAKPEEKIVFKNE